MRNTIALQTFTVVFNVRDEHSDQIMEILNDYSDERISNRSLGRTDGEHMSAQTFRMLNIYVPTFKRRLKKASEEHCINATIYM